MPTIAEATTVNTVVSAPATEAKAFLAKVEDLAAEGNALGYEALCAIANAMGKTSNKFGRPDIVTFIAYAMAMSGRNLSVRSRLDLAQIANKACGPFSKPAFKVAAKGSELDTQLSAKLNMPAQFELAIG
jgi:hypothetical protein